MPRELPRDQTKRGFYTNRSYNGDWYQETLQKRIKDGKICPDCHMILNARNKCPMCGKTHDMGKKF